MLISAQPLDNVEPTQTPDPYEEDKLREEKKQAGIAKLMLLGLSEEEARAIAGV